MSLKPALAAVIVALTVASTSRADTPIPSCQGHDAAGAATAKAAGLKHYRLSKREGATDAEMIAALGFFDAACAAGDEYVLELRAYALAGVDRYVEAAETLDAFLAAHPLTSLPAETQARIAGQEPEILKRVTSLSIDSDPTGAQITVNHRLVGTTPVIHLRLEPGSYDIEAIPSNGRAIKRTLDLVAGEHHEAFAFDAAPPPPPTAPIAATTATPPPAAPSNLRPWVIGTGAGAVAFLGLGIGGAVWANERSNTYNAANCFGSNKPGCTDTLSQYNTARALEIVGFITAGLATVATGTLFYFERKQEHPAAPPQSLSLRGCGITGGGIVCDGAF